ncbi:MAG: hypothetical protein PF961_14565 [Planctomycetota bacterium]|jgi:hypothetical protein|nr:hypothetical protein [Planctomycetota bacterium]
MRVITITCCLLILAAGALAGAEPAPSADLATRVDELERQVAALLTAQAELKQQVADLVAAKPVATPVAAGLDFFEGKEADPAALAAIPFPSDLSDKAAVREYLHALAAASEDQNSFSSQDPQVKLLRRLGVDNLDVLLAYWSTKRHGGLSFHIGYMIDEMPIGEEQKDLVLQYLPQVPNLAGVVYRNNWHREPAVVAVLKGLLMQGGRHNYVPSEVVEALSSMRDPTLYPALRQHLVSGNNRSQTYDLLELDPDFPLEEATKEAWLIARNGHEWERDRFAVQAAGQGILEALRVVVVAAQTSDNQWQRREYQTALIRLLPKPMTPEEATKWLDAGGDKLVFDAATGRFQLGIPQGDPESLF